MRRIFFTLGLTLSLLLPAGISRAITTEQCIARATEANESCIQQVELQVALTCEDDPSCAQTTRSNGLATCDSRFTSAREACYAAADTCTQQGEVVYRDCILLETTVTVEECEALRTQTVSSCNASRSSATSETPRATVTAQQSATAATSQNAISTTYSQVMSQGIIFANICSSRTAPCDCRDDGNCTVGNILQVGVNIVNFIIAISGSLVLAMFIYGGVLWIFSAGNEGMVKKGRDIIEGAVIGLFIILGAYAAVAIIVSILTKDKAVEDGTNLEDLTGGAQLFNTENP